MSYIKVSHKTCRTSIVLQCFVLNIEKDFRNSIEATKEGRKLILPYA